jgi:hypothetical protein
MSFTSIYSIDFDQIKLVDKDIVSNDQYGGLIIENDGYFTNSEQFLFFEDNSGVELCITYTISVSGIVDYDPGDYYTPPYSDVDIKDVYIEIDSFTINDTEVKLNKELTEVLAKKVKSII